MNALDTSFVIDYWNEEDHAREFFAGLEDNEPVWIPTVALFELYDSALLSDSPTENVESVDEDLDWADPLALDGDSVREAARIDADLVGRGKEIPLPDALIAGTARAADMTLIAIDRHFERVTGLDYHNPATDDGEA
jgi:predicted nucleic acid-binding protein